VRGSKLVARRQLSPNFEPRAEGKSISLVVLHYTGMASGQAAVDWLCNPDSKVSSHYLVDEDGSIVQMVDEANRAWHAGVSSWHGEIDVNSVSIGIEIQNVGHSAGCPPFPDVQMVAVAALTRDIMERQALGPQQIVGHSDIAPGRKIDPGEAFDWPALAAQGIGQTVWAKSNKALSVLETQQYLHILGYAIESTGKNDEQTRIVVKAFQRRFRRTGVSGEADAETQAILQRLCCLMPTSI
jgi:N-acetylmuramoyl-L-alanine amidase